MKKTLLFSLLLTVVSCQKESIHTEPISANADQEILGTWTVDAVQLWDGNDIQEIHTTQQTLEFTSDGRLIVIG